MSKIIAIALALLTLGLVCSRTTIAQPPNEQPSRGIAHHDSKPSALLYECDPAAGARIQCRFTELKVWRPLRAIAVNDEQRRTCTFVAHNYAQTFRRDAGADAPGWATTNGPYGVCGISREARFIGNRQADGRIYWSYAAQFRIAHKSAEDGPLRCAEIREFNENYGWQWAERREDCATIRFSPGCSSDDFPCLGDGPVTVH